MIYIITQNGQGNPEILIKVEFWSTKMPDFHQFSPSNLKNAGPTPIFVRFKKKIDFDTSKGNRMD